MRRSRLPAFTLCSAALLLGGACSGGAGSGVSLAAWNGAAAAAFTPLAKRIPVMAQQRSQFSSGAVSGPDYVVELGQSESVMASSLSAARRLPGYPGSPSVDRLYVASASLYVDAVKCELVSVGLPAGDLRGQAMLIATRLRELADRVFDQGRALTAQGLAPAGVPAGAKVVLPAEVPEWVAEGLAPGPPLAPPPPPPARYPPVREGERATEGARRWASAVRALNVPSPVGINGVLPGAAVGELGALAQQLQDDSDRIGAMPDPAVASGREKSVRRRLAILIEAEACRLGQVAGLAAEGGGSADTGIARDLLTIAGSLPQ